MTWSHGSLLATGLTHFLIAYNYIIMSSAMSTLKIPLKFWGALFHSAQNCPSPRPLYLSFGSIFLLFPMKVTGGHAYSGQGDPCPPALSDSPVNSKLRDIMRPYVPLGVKWLSEWGGWVGEWVSEWVSVGYHKTKGQVVLCMSLDRMEPKEGTVIDYSWLFIRGSIYKRFLKIKVWLYSQI